MNRSVEVHIEHEHDEEEGQVQKGKQEGAMKHIMVAYGYNDE